MVNGFFLGGAAEGMNTYADRQLKARALGLQEDEFAAQQQQAKLDVADKAIGDTMKIIGDTVKGVAANPDVGTGLGAWAEGITSIESGGDYSLKGPVTKDGDRAYGRYQVMGANIPDWTEKVLGKRMTPDEFVANPKAQDAVFATIFQQYVDETGSPDRAALKWFTGRSDDGALSLSDVNGTTGKEYLQRFAEVVASAPKNKVKAAVAPLLKDVTDIAAKVGKDPTRYVNAVNALITATPLAYEAALNEGKIAAGKKIGEANGLIRAGVAQADAMLTAGIKSAGEAGLDPNQIVNAESTLRNQFTNLSKDFLSIRDAYGRIQASASGTAAGDLALIFNYMKMLDPGSTVREGEFATAQNSTGVPGMVVNFYNQLLTGGRLNETQRKDFTAQAAKLLTAAQSQQQFAADQFRSIAKRSGLNPENVVVNFSGPQAATAAAPTGPQTTIGDGAIAENPTTGEKLIFKNGQWVPFNG